MRLQELKHNRLLTIVCAAMIAVDLFYIPLGLLSIPSYIERVSGLAIPEFGAGIGDILTNETAAELAAERGMSPAIFARYSLVLRLLMAGVFTGVGLLVLMRAREHWFGWFTAHVMLFMNSFSFFPILAVAQIVPAGVIEFSALFWPTILVYFFLFPNGKWVPGWLGFPIVGYALAQSGLQLIGLLAQVEWIPLEPFEFLVPIFEFIIPFVFIAALGSQAYRYARVSTVLERAQTRWFILAILFLLGLPAFGDAIGLGRFFFEWELLSFIFLPIALAIAILRYRLWDIDVIIRRTLQYSVLTALLALVYFGGVVLLQAVFGGLTGERDSPLITVVTTLVLAALFNPLRRRTQDWIDRRFFRAKYDAEQLLAEFGGTLRNEVDLDRLMEAVFGVVVETVQPVKVSSWLKEREQ